MWEIAQSASEATFQEGDLSRLESKSPGGHCTSCKAEVWLVKNPIRKEARDAAVSEVLAAKSGGLGSELVFRQGVRF
jgi:hypothetical protein